MSSITTTTPTLHVYYSHFDIGSHRPTVCTGLGLLKHRADLGVGSIPLLFPSKTKHMSSQSYQKRGRIESNLSFRHKFRDLLVLRSTDYTGDVSLALMLHG